ncbi:MAG: phosphoribosylamine--glycine ligase [Candidatus Eiseniibacteriota bacterium]|nr:MAG: phosphoribosylamine--glycine ligase [Candidatus Eisenbacteria bacterium]
MKVMVVGSGGREHALVWKLLEDESVSEVVCCPGNAGIAESARCVPIQVNDTEELVRLVQKDKIDLVVFGPEEPLVRGAADRLRSRDVVVFGPSSLAAALEGSKVLAKIFMKRYGIPTADAQTFDSFDAAATHVCERTDGPVVVKADGLTRGKGVVVCADSEGAVRALREMMVERKFGEAGAWVLVEERLQGEEISVMAICDGRRYLLLPCSQDHKRAQDGDIGPNTGGMGAYSPVPLVDEGLMNAIESHIIMPAIGGMARDGTPYTGVLYAGLMLTESGPKVLEFNCRFGDPEAQAVLPSLELALGETLMSAASGNLSRTGQVPAVLHSACVVACSGGYPGQYETGKRIEGLEKLRGAEGISVFHAGTKKEDGGLVTDGGRVLAVVGTESSLSGAIARAYEGLGRIEFEGMFYRRDIGARGLRAAGAGQNLSPASD